MAVSKNKALFLKGCLLMSLLLSGCGGQALSEREIVRGVFFTRQQDAFSACLVLADQNSEKDSGGEKISAAQGSTPAQALERAEQALYGDVYYGLLDLAALPSNTDLSMAREIGELLYENAQPAPELSVFVLDDSVSSWAKEGSVLYQNMKSLEKTYKVHCGLQQLFSQEEVCGIPGYIAGGGYDFLLLPQYGSPVRCHGLVEAQLAAVLCGQTSILKGAFASGRAACEARTQVLAERKHLQIHLRDTMLTVLDPSFSEEALQSVLEQELQRSFLKLQQQMQCSGEADPFHLRFWQSCQYGPDFAPQPPTLEVIFES